MALKDLLMEEFSKVQKDRIVRYVGKDKKRFDELMKLFLTGEYRVTQRAGWPLTYCAQIHPEFLSSHYKKLMDKLDEPGQNDAVIRNVVRMFQFVEIPELYHGRLMDRCFQLIADHDVAVAIKAFSLTVIENLTKLYPEIQSELRLIIEERAPHETAAFTSRAKKILKRMEKTNKLFR